MKLNIQHGVDWIAYQVGSGSWRAIPSVRNRDSSGPAETFSFSTDATGRYSVAFHCAGEGGIHLLALTREEVQTLSLPCPSAGSNTHEVSGTASNLSAGHVAQITMGDAIQVLNEGTTQYSLSQVSQGTLDLVGLEQNSATSGLRRIRIRRDLQVSGNLVDQGLDFDQGALLNPHTLTAAAGEASVELITRSGTHVPALGSTGPGLGGWFAPAAGLLAGDLYVFSASAADATRSITQVRDATVDAGDVALDLTGIALLTGVAVRGYPATYSGLSYPAAAGGPQLRHFEIVLSGPGSTEQSRVSVSAGWLGAVTSSYSLPDLSGVAGWDSAWEYSVGGAPCSTVTALLSNRGLTDLLNSANRAAGTEAYEARATTCRPATRDRSSVSEELQAAMSYAVPRILAHSLITDQPMTYIFASRAPLPAGTVIESYPGGNEAGRVTLAEPMWLMYLEPSPYEDIGHPVAYFLVDAALGQLLEVSSNAPPAVDGVLFMLTAPKPVLTVLHPLLGNMEQTARIDEARGKTYEIIAYFEGPPGDYGHCALGYRISENGKVILERIYDNAPNNVAHGGYNHAIGEYTSFYEYAIQVFGEGSAGLTAVAFPATADQVTKLQQYFTQWFTTNPYCTWYGCELSPYTLPTHNCADFVMNGVKVSLPGVVDFPTLVVATPNEIFSPIQANHSCMNYPRDLLQLWFNNTCVCYSIAYLEEIGKPKVVPAVDGQPCRLRNPDSGTDWCADYACANAMCQADMIGEYEECLRQCRTPYKLGCLNPCAEYCKTFKTHIFFRGCGGVVGFEAPTDWSYRCSDLPTLGAQRAMLCSGLW